MNKIWVWILIFLILIGVVILSISREKTISEVNETEAEGNISEVIELPGGAVNEGEAGNVGEGLEENISKSDNTG